MKLQIFIISLIIVPISSIAQITAKGLQVNDKAPLFSAIDQNGKNILLKDELKKGTVVIVFYRGQWCPYCNRQLKKLEDSLSFIKSKGATLLAITPEKPENILKTIEKTKASYSVLFDDGLKIMKQYDVAFTVDDNTLEKYKKWGIDLKVANGTNGNVLPVPAVYIINKQGIIIYKHFDPDYKQRASVQ
ncbi:MAG: AhpC/TSA family protein, partial [Bacteroidota bacterium]|nr:AhpC/TSA family protein [Bacteroidota bacterium]